MNLRTYLMIKAAADQKAPDKAPETFHSLKNDTAVGMRRAQKAMGNFINAERGRALLGASMLDPRVNSTGRVLGAGAMIGGGGLAGAGLGAVGGLSAADALGLDADSDSYLARLGRYGLAGGGAALGGIGGAGLGAIGAGHVLGNQMTQKELARAIRKMDKSRAGIEYRSLAGDASARAALADKLNKENILRQATKDREYARYM